MNPSPLLFKLDSAAGGTDSFCRWSSPSRAPYTPNTAPDAPAHTMSGLKHKLTRLPHRPETRYISRKPAFPSIRSTSGPVAASTHMFIRMCRKPM